MGEKSETRILIDRIVRWIDNYCDRYNVQALVLGVSGGVDSAVTARLCEMSSRRTICVSMPVLGEKEASKNTSYTKSVEVCYGCNVDFMMFPIDKIISAFQNIRCYVPNSFLGENKYKFDFLEGTKERNGNLCARIRSNMLYDIAAAVEGVALVVGTTNKDEAALGYITKGGDNQTDIEPLINLHKSTILEMAKELEIPKSVIDAPPSADLWEGQTDEIELGMSYKEIEWAIKWDNHPEDRLTSLIDTAPKNRDKILEKVRHRRQNNLHKNQLPPAFDPDGLDLANKK